VPSYYHYDALGSTNQVTDASEVVQNEYVYFAFGEIRFETPSPGVTNDFKWIGELGYAYDSDAEEYHVRMRTYGPKSARFASRDPLGFDGGESNVYQYSNNNPVRYVDPSGQAVVTVVYTEICRCVGWGGFTMKFVCTELQVLQDLICQPAVITGGSVACLKYCTGPQRFISPATAFATAQALLLVILPLPCCCVPDPFANRFS
jgi:RHS repeat-associated protein